MIEKIMRLTNARTECQAALFAQTPGMTSTHLGKVLTTKTVGCKSVKKIHALNKALNASLNDSTRLGMCMN